MRTYLYKLTSDRGGAPCAPPAICGDAPLLTLAICKPAIRRTAQPGDRIFGLTSRALVEREGYPPDAVLYAAEVAQSLSFAEYYAADGFFAARPDCLYRFEAETGELAHGGHSPLHSEPEYAARDIGSHPYYKNAQVLVCERFRYFGRAAMPIPPRLTLLRQTAHSLGQGHRVFERAAPEAKELDALWKLALKRAGTHTPAIVLSEAPGHAPRPSAKNTTLNAWQS